MPGLSQKHVLITGASSGIGHALARILAERGARLSLVARRADALAALADTLAADGGVAIPLSCDLERPDQRARIVPQAEEALGPIDVLVNNAGRADQGLSEILNEATLDEAMELNLKAPLQLIQAALPGMKAQQSGHIINVVSHAAFHGFALTPAYAMAKAALHALTLNLSYELVDTPIHVTGIYPGLVDTGFAKAMTPEGGTVGELMSWMRQFRAGLKASSTFKAIEKAQRPDEVAAVIADSIERPGQLMVFTQAVHQAAVAQMFADPVGWKKEADAFYGAFVPPLREMMARFVGLVAEARRSSDKSET